MRRGLHRQEFSCKRCSRATSLRLGVVGRAAGDPENPDRRLSGVSAVGSSLDTRRSQSHFRISTITDQQLHTKRRPQNTAYIHLQSSKFTGPSTVPSPPEVPGAALYQASAPFSSYQSVPGVPIFLGRRSSACCSSSPPQPGTRAGRVAGR